MRCFALQLGVEAAPIKRQDLKVTAMCDQLQAGGGSQGRLSWVPGHQAVLPGLAVPRNALPQPPHEAFMQPRWPLHPDRSAIAFVPGCL